jgi:hypothetical protein
MAAAEELSWIDTMVHPNLRYWETGDPMPRGKDSLRRRGKYAADNSTVLEQELFPISITLTGNVAVVQYNYQIAPMAAERPKSEILVVPLFTASNRSPR